MLMWLFFEKKGTNIFLNMIMNNKNEGNEKKRSYIGRKCCHL